MIKPDELTEVFCDRWFDTENTSSVISAVYYSTDEKKLLVDLHSGVTAGYQNVPADIYTALETLNSNRIQGDKNSSVGRYWNMWIKPYLEGLDTNDLDIVTQEDRDRVDSLKSLMANDVFADETTENVILANDVYVAPLEQYLFVVTFSSGEGTQSLAVKAASVQDTVDKFQEATDILGWEPVKIVSVTQHFS